MGNGVWDLQTWKTKSSAGPLAPRSNKSLLEIDNLVDRYHQAGKPGRSARNHQSVYLSAIVSRTGIYLSQLARHYDKQTRQGAVEELRGQAVAALEKVRSSAPRLSAEVADIAKRHMAITTTTDVGGGFRPTKPVGARHYEMEALSQDHVAGGELANLYQWFKTEFKTDDLYACLRYVDQRANSPGLMVQYFTDHERKAYRVRINGSALGWVYGGAPLHSIGLGDGPDMFIFVVSEKQKLYAAESIPNKVHHTSFLAGQPVLAAGQIRVDQGVLKEVTNISGHYKPDDARHFNALLFFLSHGIDLRLIQSTFQSANGKQTRTGLEDYNELLNDLVQEDEAKAVFRSSQGSAAPGRDFLPASFLELQ